MLDTILLLCYHNQQQSIYAQFHANTEAVSVRGDNNGISLYFIKHPLASHHH